MASVSVLQILRTIKDRGTISRTELQQITGLSWGTITNTTRELLNAHLIREDGSLSTKAGRKPTRLILNLTGHFMIGAELAPERIGCLAMNLAGECLWYEEAATNAQERPEAVLERLGDLIRRGTRAQESRACMGVGVAVPGSLDMQHGVLRHAPRLPGWKEFPVRAYLELKTGGEVRLEHNCNCMALAERWFGGAGEAQNVLCIHLGEGVGMGILIGGEIYRGSQSMAGEFGHVTLDADGPPCACGDRGCVESYCSASALVEYARSRPDAGDAVRHARSVEELAQCADGGDPAARGAFERMGHYLGIGIANLIDVFNPDLVVLAGRTTAGRSHFTGPLERQVMAHAWRDSERKIVVSSLGILATAMGACGMILQEGIARIRSAHAAS